MEKLEEERKTKQAYLREAIVDAGYNTDRFIQYLLSIKENGADVDNWTLSELQAEVKTYKRLYAVDDVSEIITDQELMASYKRQPSTIFVDLPETEPIEKQSTFTAPAEEEPQSLPQEEVKKSITDEFVDLQPVAHSAAQEELVITTRQPEPQDNPDIEISIIDSKIVKPGFLSRNYAAYGIKSSLREPVIYRKEDDFNLLRSTLVKICPGYVIPALPENPIKKLDPEHMQNRRAELEVFLKKVMVHPLLKQLKVIRDFITIENDDLFESLKKDMSKASSPKELSEFLTPEGKANVIVADSSIQACNDINEASKAIIDEFTNIKFYNKELLENFNALYNTLYKISSSYKRIAMAYSTTEVEGLFVVFDTLGDSFQKMMESCRQFQGSISENFYKYFKYPTREMGAVRSVISQWSDHQSQYKKAKKKLKDRKEALFVQKQVTAWELSPECQYTFEVLLKDKKIAFNEMLPNDTKEINKLKNLYGYYCNKVPEEYKRICDDNGKEFQKHMTSVAHMNCDIFERLRKLWDDTYNYFSKVN